MALGMPFPKQISPEVPSELLCGLEFLLFKVPLGLFFLGCRERSQPQIQVFRHFAQKSVSLVAEGVKGACAGMGSALQ